MLKNYLFLTVLVVMMLGLSGCVEPSPEKAPAYDQAFISDEDFEDYRSMSLDEIQAFLVKWNSCLQGQIQDVDGQSFEPAETIYEAAQTHHINPKVLLATAEKEQRAITSSQLPAARLALLMGAGSPSTARHQIPYAAQLLRSYLNDLDTKGTTISGWKVGLAKLTEDGVQVTPANRAVAALFTYTPYAGAQWGGNQPQWGGNYLFYDAWYNKFRFGKAPAPSPTPIPEKAGPSPGELIRVGDFSISISEIKKEADTAILNLAITKVTDGNDRPGLVEVTLVDDHGNEYKGSFSILELEEAVDIEGAEQTVDEIAKEITDPALKKKVLEIYKLSAKEREELASTLSKHYGRGQAYHLAWMNQFIFQRKLIDTVLSALPKGFIYVEPLAIRMPQVATIERIRIGQKELPFREVKPGVPQFLGDFGKVGVTEGQAVPAGKWLTFATMTIEPVLRAWTLPIEVENKEYHPLSASVKIAVQYEDGTIRWSSEQSTEVAAQSKKRIDVALPIPIWVDDGPPQPRALLFLFTDKAGQEIAVRMSGLAVGDLPPLVGQGPKEIEDKFISAYRGKKTMGNPLGLPRWFSGGKEPKDEHDVLIQEFPAVSDFGKSAIVWDKQGKGSQANVLHGPILDKYLSLGGPYAKVTKDTYLGAPIGQEQSGTHPNLYVEFEHGFIVTDGKTSEIIPLTGKIAFMSHSWQSMMMDGGLIGSRLELRVLDLGTRKLYTILTPEGLTSAASDSLPKYSALRWSADGSKVAFTTRKGVYEIDTTDGKLVALASNIELGPHYSRGESRWSPDGSKIVFTTGMPGSALHVMDANGRNKISLLSRPAVLSGGSFASFWNPAWSPDGNQIAFGGYRVAKDGRANPGVYVLYIASRETKLVSELKDQGQYDDGGLSWSPDGKTLVLGFVQERADGRGLFKGLSTLDLSTGALARLPLTKGTWAAEWSPYGNWIAYLQNEYRSATDLLIVQNSKWGIYRVLTKGEPDIGSYSWWVPPQAVP